MLAFNEFNPYALIGKQAIPDAKRAKGAKVDATSTSTLAGLAALAGQRPQFHHAPVICPAGCDATDWQKYFDERMDVAERIGKMPRDKAEQQAYEACITRWLDTTPVNVPLDTCPHCLQRVNPNAATAFVVNGGGHMLHHSCNPHWISRRRHEAIAALAKAGIKTYH